ncbi:hypothetical protein N7510_002876 [Penicillium lagena]|uniref:uncharacterized protein n=1 Tax=Penicillium lagena TaxID=94218 RepID=UPI0025421506|nr:uncharacterized protein N7510_002876 [Penicillium lagena]KAJ5618892.1 hypothetical protein N7510_002876 [Penicillium lagena]
MAETKRPVGLLFDIGGAILDYELSKNIPPGWVNFSISRTSPHGSWHRLERGEIPMDAEFFAAFNRDLRNPDLWKQFHEISRTPDPYMYPALKKLRASGQFVMGALSNTTKFPEGHPYNKDVSGVKSQFDFFISSAHTGLRKPDPKIYQVAIQEMDAEAKKRGFPGANPADIVFLDDIGENLKAAKKAGLRTVKVTLGKTDGAVRELEKITGLQLLEEDKARL